MSQEPRFSGDLQAQVMSILWRREAGTVEQVRSALPGRYRGASTTVQTVLNRLSERGLLSRHQVRNTIEYRPRVSETEYLARWIASTLAGAASEARCAVLSSLIAWLDAADLGSPEPDPGCD